MGKTIKKSSATSAGKQVNNDKICHNCGSKLTNLGHNIVGKEGKMLKLCDKCHDGIQVALSKQSKGANYPMAIIVGLALGIIGALIWFGAVVITKWQVGLVALVAGYLAGLGVFIGSGKRRSINLQILSAVIALASILFGEYLIANHFARDLLISEGYFVGSYFLNPLGVLEIMFISITRDLLTLVFWGIAVWVGYTVAKPLKLHKVQ